MSARNTKLIEAVNAVSSVIFMETGRCNAKKEHLNEGNAPVIQQIDMHISHLRRIRQELEDMLDKTIG